MEFRTLLSICMTIILVILSIVTHASTDLNYKTLTFEKRLISLYDIASKLGKKLSIPDSILCELNVGSQRYFSSYYFKSNFGINFPNILVTRSGIKLAKLKDKVFRKVHQALAARFSNIRNLATFEVNLNVNWNKIVPKNLNFDVKLISQNKTGFISANLIGNDYGHSVNIPFGILVRASFKVPTATRNIRKGEKISYKITTASIPYATARLLASENELNSMVAATSIPKGAKIYKSYLEFPYHFDKGSIIKVTFKSGNVEVEVPATVVSQNGPNIRVRFQNRVYSAKIVDGKAVIQNG